MSKYNFYGIGLINGAVLQSQRSALISYEIDNLTSLKKGAKQRFFSLRDVFFVRGFFALINYLITFFSAMDLSLILLNESLLSKKIEYKLKVRKSIINFYILTIVMAFVSFIILPLGLYFLFYFLGANKWFDIALIFIRGLAVAIFFLSLKLFKHSKQVYKYNYAINKLNNAMYNKKYLSYNEVRTSPAESVFSCSNFVVLSMALCYMFVPVITFNIHFLINVLIKLVCAILFVCLAYELLFGIEYIYRKNSWAKIFAYPFLWLSQLTTVRCEDSHIKTVAYGYEELIQMTTTRKDFSYNRENYRKVYNEIKTKLFENGITEAREADYIICDTLGIDRAALITKDSFSKEEIKKINKTLSQRLEHKPLCKIVGKRNFYGRDFFVDMNVLSPRQETELLVNKVLQEIKNKNTKQRVLDLCTGSGAIAVTIDLESNSTVFASDKSKRALNVAQKNGQKLGAKVQFVQSDMFKNLKEQDKFDIIVSNPPYIPTEDIQRLDKEVKDFDPIMALDGGDDGLNFYRIIAKKAPHFLSDNGKLFLEIGYDQAKQVVNLLQNDFQDIQVIKDYDDLDRIVIASKRI